MAEAAAKSGGSRVSGRHNPRLRKSTLTPPGSAPNTYITLRISLITRIRFGLYPQVKRPLIVASFCLTSVAEIRRRYGRKVGRTIEVVGIVLELDRRDTCGEDNSFGS